VDPAPAGGPDAWRCYLPELRLALEPEPPDRALSALPLLTDPEQARGLLEPAIRAANPAYRDLRIQRCTPRVMRYTPGSRCTILYQLDYATPAAADRAWPRFVVAKTYKGQKGQDAYASMRALWNSDFARSGRVTLAEPLAYLPETRVLLQGPVPEEQTLQVLIAAALEAGTPAALERASSALRQTAAGLAAPHRSEVRVGRVYRWEDELSEVRKVLATLVSAVPALADAATPLLLRLEALAATDAADPLVPVHGTFRPGQVLLSGGQLGFIDFDGFAQAEPALDLALFLRRVKDIGLGSLPADARATRDAAARQTRLTQVEALCQSFLTDYARHMAVSPRRIELWEALELMTLVLHCWTKVKPARLAYAMVLLDEHLQRMRVT
jgi:hypothetical protein